MLTVCFKHSFPLFIYSFAALWVLLEPVAQAQIVPDATTGSLTNTQGNTIAIDGGTRSGDILLHSFNQFSIPQGVAAQFNNAPDLRAVITRVTGANASFIDGLLATQGVADFFLINPNGIFFGPGAELAVGGSFLASTADSIVFDNGAVFSAIAPQDASLLTVSTPIGLQYGAAPTAIEVSGNGHNFAIDPLTLEILSTGPRNGLQVSEGNTLALIGGPIILDGGNFTVSNGRLLLGSLGPGNSPDNGRVALATDALGWSVDLSQVSTFADIDLVNASSLVTTGNGGGDVQLIGQGIDLLDGSTILANTQGDGTSYGISLQATNEIVLAGAQFDATTGEGIFPTSLFAEVDIGATAQGGEVTLSAPYLFVGEGAQISTSVFDVGDGGNIDIIADLVEVVGGTPDFGSSGFFLQVIDAFSLGNGGDLNLQADELVIAGGALIDNSTFGPGNAGNINVWADQITLEGGAAELGPSRIVSQVQGSGRGGNLSFSADRFTILDGAILASEAFGVGNGGTIQVEANEVVVTGTSPGGFPSRISSLADRGSTGNSGAIALTTNQLTIAQGAEVTSSTLSSGNAGPIVIQAQSIDVIGAPDLPTGIFSTVNVGSTGNGSQVSLATNRLVVRDGAQVVVGTRGPGAAGNLNVTAETITLSGRNEVGVSSGLFANTLIDTGAGGTITVNTDELLVENGATINASNFPSFADLSVSPGQGAAGDIEIQAETIQLSNQALITTSTFTGDRGNINLTSNILMLRNQSAITTNASQTATGGNINLDLGFLITTPNANSDITANAVRGQGGNIRITAQGIFGTAFRNQQTPQSDITASSEFGVDGTVDIQLGAIDPSGALAIAPIALNNSDNQIVAGCPADMNTSFTVTGRGGLPSDPRQGLVEEVLLPAFELPPGLTADRAGPVSPTAFSSASMQAQFPLPNVQSAVPPIMEATQMRRNEQGQLELIGHAETTFHSTAIICQQKG